MTDNVLHFSGPLLREESVEFVRNGPFPKGVVIGLHEDGGGHIRLSVFGDPSDRDLLWMAKQLELFALDPDAEAEEISIDEPDPEIS